MWFASAWRDVGAVRVVAGARRGTRCSYPWAMCLAAPNIELARRAVRNCSESTERTADERPVEWRLGDGTKVEVAQR